MFAKDLSKKIVTVFLILSVGLAFPVSSLSQEQNEISAERIDTENRTSDVGLPTLDEIKERRAFVESSEDILEKDKKNVLRFLDQAIRFREESVQLKKSAEEITRMVTTAPARITEIEAKLERPPPEKKSVESQASKMEPAQIEQHVRQLESDVAAAKKIFSQREDQLKEQETRPEQLRQAVERAKQRLIEIDQEIKAGISSDATPLTAETQRVALLAEQDKLLAEIESYEQHLANHDTLISLIAAERDLMSRELNHMEKELKIWLDTVQRLRQLEAKKERLQAEQAKDLAVGLPPFLQKQLEINIQLGQMLEKVTAEESQIAEKLEAKQAQLEQIEEESKLAREQVKYPIHTETIGLALREQRKALPNIQNYKRESGQRQLLLGEIRTAQISLDRQRKELADFDQAVERVIQSAEQLPKTRIEDLKFEISELLKNRRDLLKKLQAGYRRLFKKVQNLEFIDQEIATKAEDVADFLDGHLLWIRSAQGFGMRDLKNLPAALNWILNPSSWWQFLQDLGRSFGRNPVGWVLGLAITAFLIGCRRRARRDISLVAKKVSSVHTDSFILTLRALGLTCLLAFGWPFLMGFVVWQLGNLPIAQSFTRSVGNGLLFAAEMLVIIRFVSVLCRPQGIAETHFKWPEGVLKTLRSNLLWLTQLAVPMSFINGAVQNQNISEYSDSLGRSALIILMVGFSIFYARVLSFSGDIISRLKGRRRDSWIVRLRYIWYPLAVGVPLVMALLAGMGYYYSASALEERMLLTILLILGLVSVNALAHRWLFVIQRRLALKDAQRKWEAQRERQLSQEDDEEGAGREAAAFEEPEVGLAQIDEQTQALLRTVMLFAALIGLWAIWQEVLPALRVIGDVALWTYKTEFDGVTKIVPITLTYLLLAAIFAAITFEVARNLPGVLEITLLKHLSMDAGARHAVTTLARYAIIAIGVIVTFNILGIRWSSLQWLVAALGVGLGFGLQEIVANFVSGLIVLFERPYRVGDFVTVGNVSGTVTRIRIRATTVRDLNRRELIVPNKNFITGELINWSLSDKILRLDVPVGIAYGSDTALAKKLLLKVAEDNPEVLDRPEPSALFLGFGDNSLNFELRAFIDDPMKRFDIMDKLHLIIDDAFRKADITIAFPQRDMHLDQIGPLEVRVLKQEIDKLPKS